MSNPIRFSARMGGLLVIDIQPRLMSAMPGKQAVQANAVRLVKAARALEMPVWATEQNPEKLGPTAESLHGLLPERHPKMAFSGCAVGRIREELLARGVRHVTLLGVEAHVCVAQTALDLLELGLAVQVPADAVASRAPLDRETALRRLREAGVVVTTTEASLFEWIGGADHPAFPVVRELVKVKVPWPDPAPEAHTAIQVALPSDLSGGGL
jgi:nicotinamidase-related amidase